MFQIQSDQQPKVDPTAAAREAIRGQLAQLQQKNRHTQSEPHFL